MQNLIDNHWHHGPHFQFANSIVFVTWRLAFTLPRHLLDIFSQLKQLPHPEKTASAEELKRYDEHAIKCFLEYDKGLGVYRHPGFSLNDPPLSQIIKDALQFWDGERCELHAYCIMSNHVHILIRSRRDDDGNYHQLSKIVQSVKSWTSRRINEHLGRQGPVWDDFYFDRMVRNANGYENVVRYILDNPVEAGLVKATEDWKDSFYKPGYWID